MTHVADLLDRLADGTITVDDVVADFRARDWPMIPPVTMEDAILGADPPDGNPDSWCVVNSDSRLTPAVYARLAAAYNIAVLERT